MADLGVTEEYRQRRARHARQGVARARAAGRPYVVLLSGGIASGKSSVARLMQARGARRIDLDALSHEVYEPGSEVLRQVVQAFGEDVLDERGCLVRTELARRAFVSPEATRRLEAIVHPAVRELLAHRLCEAGPGEVCVVEVPLLDRVEDLLSHADEAVCVTCPLDVRRERAQARDAGAADFDARVAAQPSDDYLRAHTSTEIVNDKDEHQLRALVDAWCDAHGLEGET